jgi:hypothetical protein
MSKGSAGTEPFCCGSAKLSKLNRHTDKRAMQIALNIPEYGDLPTASPLLKSTASLKNITVKPLHIM